MGRTPQPRPAHARERTVVKNWKGPVDVELPHFVRDDTLAKNAVRRGPERRSYAHFQRRQLTCTMNLQPSKHPRSYQPNASHHRGGCARFATTTSRPKLRRMVVATPLTAHAHPMHGRTTLPCSCNCSLSLQPTSPSPSRLRPVCSHRRTSRPRPLRVGRVGCSATQTRTRTQCTA